MSGVVIVIVVVVVLLVIAGIAALVLARRRRQRELAQEFGPEYERLVEETGDRKQAEKELRERKDRHDQHDLRPLGEEERERLRADWQQVQRSFLDDPGGAVEHADALLVTIMRQRGYPVEDAQRRTDDLSVAQPHLVEEYRNAQRVAHAHRGGTATTEDLRSAFTSYRSLVEALLDDGGSTGHPGGPATGGGAAGHGRGGHPEAATERIDPAASPAAGGEGTTGQGPGRGDGRPPGPQPPTGGRDGYEERRR